MHVHMFTPYEHGRATRSAIRRLPPCAPSPRPHTRHAALRRYPAGEKPHTYYRIFYDENVLEERARKALEVNREVRIESEEVMAERRRMMDRAVANIPNFDPIKEYELDLSLRPELACNNPPEPEVPNDLGPIPDWVTSSSSLLLFNTTINAYEDHTPVDNLAGEWAEQHFRDEDETAAESAPQIADAPDSVCPPRTHRWQRLLKGTPV